MTKGNNVIAKNSLFMTIRMIVVLFISLFTTRVVLDVLGVEDYGIYNVVCGFVSMFAFLNTSMTSATQRFYNYELGKYGPNGVRKVYNASFTIHVVLALVVVVLIELFGLWYVENKLIIPTERMDAAVWIFHFSVVSLFFNMVNVPYAAVIMAYERMSYYAVIGIIDAALKLLIVYSLCYFEGDKLIIYGFLFLLIVLFDFCAYILYAKRHFKELKFGVDISRKFYKEMLSFAGWNLFGSFAYMIREQGINLVLNAYFGPLVNAAKGIANQVNGALSGFSANILVPARPQIVQSYAQGNYERSFRLMNSISKISFLVFLILSLPICFEINPILTVWLGENVPEFAHSFIILMLVTNTWGSLVAPISAVVHATGKMRFYQIISSISNLMSLPLALFLLLFKRDPNIVFFALLITMFTNHISGLVALKHLTSFPIKHYVKEVIIPLFVVAVLSVLTTLIPYLLIVNTLINFLVIGIVSTISIICYSYWICFDQAEKLLIKSITKSIINKKWNIL